MDTEQQPRGPVDRLDLLDVRNQLALQLKEGFTQVNTRIDTFEAISRFLDGRVRAVEVKSAIHSWAIGIVGAVGVALLGGMVAILVQLYSAP